MDETLDLEYERLLGEGSYGKVFLVRQQDGQKFAVKEIDLCKCDEDGRAQALDEATLLSRVKHDNILAYIESVMNEDCLYIVTEFCGGGDLEDYLDIIQKSELSVPEPLVSEWVLQIGGALKYLHDMRILHRDMKTKNIFLKEDLTVKLGDLGIAKVLDLNQSKANTFIGTPSYMSPELFTGKPYNHKTDIWGLGCCAYEMLTLKRAFEGKALWTLIKEIRNGKELDLPDLYSLELRALIQDMMSQSPESRPSANDIVENDYLVYHRGTAKKIINDLPTPNKKVEKKKSLAKGTGNHSGSFDRMLQQKNKLEDQRLRESVASICDKINTLRSTLAGDEEMNTFVYRGEEDTSDCELEASNTILDGDTLKQYTQQLDTFVYKGDSDSDSDYHTEGTLSRRKGHEDEDTDATLVRQYSNTLEELDSDGEEEEENESGVQNSTDFSVRESRDFPDSRLGRSSARLEETLTSRYSKYNDLKDTLSLNEGKKFRRSQSGQSGSPSKQQQSGNKAPVNGSKHSTGKSLSNSFSGAETLNSYRTKSSDPRLNKTMSFDQQSRLNESKMKTCDRLEQSFLNKSDSHKGLKSTKKAFCEDESKPSEDLDVSGVMSHLKEKLTLYTEDNVPSTMLNEEGQATGDGHDGQESPGRKGKKKNTYIKKEAAKKKSSDPDSDKLNGSLSTDREVTLFTRAQAVTFNKDSSMSHENGEHNELQHIQQLMHEDEGKLTNDHLIFVQRTLASGIGEDRLIKVMSLMSLVQCEEEMKVCLAHELGPGTFNKYKEHLLVLHRLELWDSAMNKS